MNESPQMPQPSTAHPREPRSPIAVVGISAICPGSQDVDGFWRDVLAGRDLLRDVPATHFRIEDYHDSDPSKADMTYGRRGSFLSEIEIDPLEFGIPPSLLPATDTAQLLGLVAAKQLLDDMTLGRLDDLPRDRISVILGATSVQELALSMGARLQRPIWRKAMIESGIPETEADRVCDRIAEHFVPWSEATFPGLLANVIAGRIANRFDFGGTNFITDAACASTFSALAMAVHELDAGTSDIVITGGVEALNDIFMFMCFSKTPALSPTQDCRPFSDRADGTMLGEGVAMLALKRLADAERDGDRIYAVVRGVGASSDGRATSIYAPLPRGQARALRRAYESAGYLPSTVELVEAHGTGTKAGDVAEVGALRDVFGASGQTGRPWCALGSVKSQIGHTKAAAGGVSLLKVILALQHKILPPTIKVDRPNPKLELDSSPFYLNTEARPWIRDASHPRRASASSFGFGGTNFHVTVEEYVSTEARAERRPLAQAQLFLQSAADAGALLEACRRIGAEDMPEGTLAFLARESHGRFQASDPFRLAVVARDEDELRGRLRRAVDRIEADSSAAFDSPDGVYYGVGTERGGVAFLFPGQGSQRVGMGAELAMEFDCAREVWDRVAGLELEAGLPLHDVVFPRPAFTDEEREERTRRLTATEWAQPALGVCSASLLAVLGELGVRPDFVAGHSFGELTALHAAGAMSLDNLVRAARRRGELMAEAAADVPGAMTAVAHPLDEVERLLAEWGSDVAVANHNAPRQVVLAGATDAVEQVERRFAEAGVTARRLPVATAFHSPLVSDSCAPFLAFLGDIPMEGLAVPVFSNAEAAPYPADPEAGRSLLAGLGARTVRFVEMVRAMLAAGARTFVEVGPGRVLTGLVGQCLAEEAHVAVALDSPGRHGVEALWHGLGQLAARGVAMDLEGLLRRHVRPADPRARKRPRMAVAISGANYGKPYPTGDAAPGLPPAPAWAARASTPHPTPNPIESMAAPKTPPEAPTVARTTPASPPPGGDWVETYREVQRQTADAHAAFQKHMTESHLVFLRTAESLLQRIAGGGAPDLPGLALPTAPDPVPGHALPGSRMPSPPSLTMAPPPFATSAPAPVPADAPSAPPSAAATSGGDLERIVLAVVTERTGYPSDLLEPTMELEADLGIDSIKRVEILSAVQERSPQPLEVEASVLGGLRTLGEILDYLERLGGPATGGRATTSLGGGRSSPVAPSPASPATADPPAPIAGAGPDLRRILLSVVAERTGYPEDLLEPDMDLEADLGIDSIKRVEVLSGVQDRAPTPLAVEPAQMAALRTLGEIIAYLDRLAGNPAAQAPDRTMVSVLPARPAPRAAPGRVPPDRWVLGAAETPATGLGVLRSIPPASTVAVVGDGDGVGPALARELESRGYRVQRVAAGEAPDADAAGLILLHGLARILDPRDGLVLGQEAFAAARVVAPTMQERGGLLVTVTDLGGRFGLGGCDPARAWIGGLGALTKTAALEWDQAHTKAIDLERGERGPDDLAAVIVAELEGGGPEIEVGLPADGTRWTPRLWPAPLRDDGGDLGAERPFVVATGGARGVTAACLLELARRTGARLLVLGRTRLDREPAWSEGAADEAALRRALVDQVRAGGGGVSPRELEAQVAAVLRIREARSALDDLEKAGAEVRYGSIDVTDTRAVARIIAATRGDWGAVQGLVHGAGVISDRMIATKSDDEFERVVATKVLGLDSLLEATRDDPLQWICLFSSVTGRTGNAGQADYAMANETLNKIAQAEAARRGGSCVVKSIGWGPWQGGMVGPELEERLVARGARLIPLEDGVRAFMAELADRSGGAVEVVIGDSLGPGALPEVVPVPPSLVESNGAGLH